MRLPLIAALTGVTLAAGIILFSTDAPLETRASPPGDDNAVAASGAPASLVSVEHSGRSEASSPRPSKWTGAERLSSLPAVQEFCRQKVTMRRAFFRLARRDRARAVELALRLPGTRLQNLALASIARDFGRPMPSREGHPPGRAVPPAVRLTRMAFRGNLPPILTLRIAAQLPIDHPTTIIAYNTLAEVASTNPEAARAMAKLHPNSTAASIAITHGWSQNAPREALDWARTLDPVIRSEVLSALAVDLAKQDVTFATNVLPEIPSPHRRRAVDGIAQVWARFDTEAALNWASSLPDPTEAESALSMIREIAPTGIGITLSSPPGSPYPTAINFVSGGPAAKSGAIRAGDAIVAVGDGNGSWISTSGRNLQTISESIRGKPGEAVQLQILPAGTTDPSRARTVTLTREQILLKSPQRGLPSNAHFLK